MWSSMGAYRLAAFQQRGDPGHSTIQMPPPPAAADEGGVFQLSWPVAGKPAPLELSPISTLQHSSLEHWPARAFLLPSRIAAFPSLAGCFLERN